MNPRPTLIDRITQHERINFLATNRIPRRFATRVMGWFSRIEHPIVCRGALFVWQRFGGDLKLHEAKKTRFASVHDCFVRELRDGARPVDRRPGVLVSPCDAIVGACGRIDGVRLIQAKGFDYSLRDLLVDPALAAAHRDGVYVTLRLTSTMYHRFHAPDDCLIDEVIHVPGDLWNVNPIALGRVERLYCRNERAVVSARLTSGGRLTLVPIAAILVPGIRLHFVDVQADGRDRRVRRHACQASFARGAELGYFEHGSTIVVLGGPGLTISGQVRQGVGIRMGEPLLERHPTTQYPTGLTIV